MVCFRWPVSPSTTRPLFDSPYSRLRWLIPETRALAGENIGGRYTRLLSPCESARDSIFRIAGWHRFTATRERAEALCHQGERRRTVTKVLDTISTKAGEFGQEGNRL